MTEQPVIEDERLIHLKEWMNMWIDNKILNLEWYSYMINFFTETDLFLFNISDLKLIPFEEYCNQFNHIPITSPSAGSH